MLCLLLLSVFAQKNTTLKNIGNKVIGEPLTFRMNNRTAIGQFFTVKKDMKRCKSKPGTCSKLLEEREEIVTTEILVHKFAAVMNKNEPLKRFFYHLLLKDDYNPLLHSETMAINKT